jgi:hypothetical protein
MRIVVGNAGTEGFEFLDESVSCRVIVVIDVSLVSKTEYENVR